MIKEESSPFIPIVVTLVIGIFWAIFILLHVLFWASNFDLFQNIVIILVSLVLVACADGLMWVFWVFKRA